MKALLTRFLRTQHAGLIIVILLLCGLLTAFAGTNPRTGANQFLNLNTLLQVLTEASFFAIMAVGVTMVVITGGIDLSVGSIYALSSVMTAIALQSAGPMAALPTVMLAAAISLGIGTLCGLANGAMITGLRVHPFIITLGTMWILRGIAFVASGGNSKGVPDSLIYVVKFSMGMGSSIHPIPTLIMLAVILAGEVLLVKTVTGRNIYAVGGNSEASRYCGLRIDRSLLGVYVICGLSAGIAALVGTGFYGAASCADATGYELFVIASAVVGGASLMGGRGSAVGAMLGAMLIVLIRQSVTTLHLDQKYEWIIIGCAIIVAVVLDRVNAQLSAKRMARMAGKQRLEARS